jgi:hypothetical protein
MLSKYVGRKTSSIENDINKARSHSRQRGNIMRVFFGIDVSKASSEVAILINGEKVHGYTIPNAAIGFNRLLGDFLAKEHITKRGNPYARKILFKCIHNIASASHTNPCHIADFYDKRKRQSQVTSTKPRTIASIHRLIRTMYYLITHNKLYDYTSTQNR